MSLLVVNNYKRRLDLFVGSNLGTKLTPLVVTVNWDDIRPYSVIPNGSRTVACASSYS